jgi:ethanolamine permease
VIYLTPQGSPVGGVLLNMAVLGAVLAYIFQTTSFILLRVRFPNIRRPYVSPLGIAGATLAGIIALITLVMLFRNPDYNKGVIGAAVWFVLGVGYYAGYARHRLVLAPEEEAAFTHRRKGPV